MSQKYTLEQIIDDAQKLLELDPYLFQERDASFFKSDDGKFVEINPYRGAFYIDGRCVYGQRDDLRFGVSSFGQYPDFDSLRKRIDSLHINSELKEVSRDDVPIDFYLDRFEYKRTLIKPDFRGLSVEDLEDLVPLYDRGYFSSLNHNSIDITTAEGKNIIINFGVDYFKGEVFMRKELFLDGECLYGDRPSAPNNDIVLYGKFTDFDKALNSLKDVLSKEPFKEISLTNRQLELGHKGVFRKEIEARLEDRSGMVHVSTPLDTIESRIEYQRNYRGLHNKEYGLTFLHSINPLTGKSDDKLIFHDPKSFNETEQKILKEHTENKLIQLGIDPNSLLDSKERTAKEDPSPGRW